MKVSAETAVSVPPKVLADIENMGQSHGVSEIWLFGSAANTNGRAKPNDWDFALLGVPSERWFELSQSLKRHFSNCKVESVFDYTIKPKPNVRHGVTPIHFVLGTADMQRQMHPIIASIKSGLCLYRAA